MTIHETHRHHFQVADVGDWDLDQDRSIVPSIHSSLKRQGIEGVVDGDEMDQAVSELLAKLQESGVIICTSTTEFAIAALKADGSVVAWGDSS